MTKAKVITSALIGLALVSLVILAANVSPKPVNDPKARPSTVFTDDTGARASLLLLQKALGYRAASQFKEPLWNLESPDNGGPGTLIVAGPSVSLQPLEAEHLEQWVESGGQLILFLTEDWVVEGAVPFSARLGVDFESRRAYREDVTLKSSSLTLQVSRDSTFEGEFEPFLETAERSLAVQIPIGEGRVILFPDTSVILNKSFSEADNAVWLVRLIEEWGNGRVVFDEFHHGLGERGGFRENLKGFLWSIWGLPFVHLGLLGLFYTVVNRRRLGRAVQRVDNPLREPGLLVEARAGLLQASRSYHLAVERLCDELAYELRGGSHRPVALEKLAEKDTKVARLLECRRQAELGRFREAGLLEVCKLIGEIRKEYNVGS